MALLLIDSFANSADSNVYVITHAHSDHGSSLSKKFKYPVHCSPITKYLMQISHPKVFFVADLICGAWTFVEDKILVYIFDSVHCVGGIGIYCPDLNLLHFGDGRPSKTTIFNILHFNKTYVDAKKPLDVKCDVFVHKVFNEFNISNTSSHALFPTLKQSRDLLRKTIVQHSSSSAIQILVTHFGTLSCLPHEFGYTWVHDESLNSHSQKWCKEAFGLFNFNNGPINIAHAWCYKKKWKPQDKPNVKTIILSANWFFQNHKNVNLNEIGHDKDGYLRIFVCGHASEQELNNNYQGLCLVN